MTNNRNSDCPFRSFSAAPIVIWPWTKESWTIDRRSFSSYFSRSVGRQMALNGDEKALVGGGRIPGSNDAAGSVDADNEGGNNNPRSGDDNNERSCWNS
jgi:hypothetical protein